MYFTAGTMKNMYISLPVKNGKEIIDWFAASDLPNLCPAKDLHVTVAYSTALLNWSTIPLVKHDVIIESSLARSVQYLGDCLVLMLESKYLQQRWDVIREAGASWDYPNYQPHVSIITNPPENLPVQQIVPWYGDIHLGPEIREEIKK